ncbi:MAG TPA: glutamate--tRNA ligase [Saprospiraceae bacterium]|nr:glutamate--tRNA ligase [Saprospiraceae bacterium]
MSNIRVRFAPSPTGPLHIGGLRTALYNFLWAKKNDGVFILRIEDTDQKRYVQGAEDYIQEALSWSGLQTDEGPHGEGEYGPYRQSDRTALYKKHIKTLLDNGCAYYAFDTEEDLEQMRERRSAEGVVSPKYDWSVRREMKNSLNMSKDELKAALDSERPHVIRLKVEPGKKVGFKDIVRDQVQFNTDELDDKVLLKSDGLPTYHFANVVDDHEMEISHVIRGEEWLSSTGHHVLLYQAFGWEPEMPQFAHLPLILKPEGKGKLSKRDGAKFGIPVFPLRWDPGSGEEPYAGFREFGFLPEAMINFLAFLGWNPGGEKEIYNLDELIADFQLGDIGKSGSRFDFDKALWYNQQYILQKDSDFLIPHLEKELKQRGLSASKPVKQKVCALFQERIQTLNDLWPSCYYCFEEVAEYDRKPLKKKWKGAIVEHYSDFLSALKGISEWSASEIEEEVKSFMKSHELGFGQVLPILRLALTGTMQGPSIFEVAAVIGREKAQQRLEFAPEAFISVLENK